MLKDPQRETVLIFGATSAIAAEVAVIWASRGARLMLVGRSPAKLSAVAARCGGVEVEQLVADLGEPANNERIVATCIARLGHVDSVLIAHGDLGDQLASERSFEEAERILRINFTSVVALLVPVANHMEQTGRGRVAVITSVAGDRGRPRNYTYGAAKGALNVYLQGLRSRLYPTGVSVTTIKLGPVDTPMTRTHKKSAVFGEVPSVARDIVKAIDTRSGDTYVPAFWSAIMPIVRNTPEPLFQRLPFLSGR